MASNLPSCHPSSLAYAEVLLGVPYSCLRKDISPSSLQASKSKKGTPISTQGDHDAKMETNLEGAEKCLIYTHHGTSIVEFTTVVGGRKECHQMSLRKEFVSVFDDLRTMRTRYSNMGRASYLMCSANQVHIVFLQETRNDIWAKGKRYTTVVF